MSDQYQSLTALVASSYSYNNNIFFRQQHRSIYQSSSYTTSQQKNRAYSSSQYLTTGYQQRSQSAFENVEGYQPYRFQQSSALSFTGQRQITSDSTDDQP